MKKIILAVAMTAMFAGTGAAHAQTSPIFDWSGFYAGANAGYARVAAHDTLTTDLGGGIAGGPLELHGKESDLVGGLRGAINYQVDHFVYGIDGSWTFGNVVAKTHCTIAAFILFSLPNADCLQENKSNNLFDLRARAGWASDRVLLFAAGGVATMRYSSVLVPQGSIALPDFNNLTFSKWVTGWTIGGGVEYALSKNWVFGAEYKYYDFGSVSGSDVSGGPPVTVFTKTKLTENIVMMSLSYKFGN